jgi:RNA polymerase sigma-70 factor (ECF subfamily)
MNIMDQVSDDSSAPRKPLTSVPQPDSDCPPATTWDDKEIFLRKVFDDDPAKGCELLFKQYYQPLCSHAVRFVYSREIAQDLVSDLFYTFWQKQLYAQITTSFRAYLFIAIRNRSLKYIRKEFGKIDPAEEWQAIEHPSPDPTPQQTMQYHELYTSLEQGIHALTPQCQKVFLLNRFEGKKYQEVATELNISLKTVEAHMSKALSALRKVVRQDMI